MKKQNLFFIIGMIICIILLIVLLVIINISKPKDDKKKIAEKLENEFEFFDEKTIDIINELNNIKIPRYKIYEKTVNQSDSDITNSNNSKGGEKQEASQEGNDKTTDIQHENITYSELDPISSLTENSEDVDWNQIAFLFEDIYSNLTTFEIDLNSLQVSGDIINNYKVSLNSLALSINKKDKKSSMENGFNVYSNLMQLVSLIINDNYKLSIYNIKLTIINIYTKISLENNWEESYSILNNLLKNYSIENNDQNKKEKLNKIKLLLDNLENVLILKDKNVFFMQYKILIQELQT